MEDRLSPAGAVLEGARELTGLSKRSAASLAHISEGRWRQIVTGVEKRGKGVELPVNPKRDTLIAMAVAVRADVNAVLEAAGMEATSETYVGLGFTDADGVKQNVVATYKVTALHDVIEHMENLERRVAELEEALSDRRPSLAAVAMDDDDLLAEREAQQESP